MNLHQAPKQNPTTLELMFDPREGLSAGQVGLFTTPGHTDAHQPHRATAWHRRVVRRWAEPSVSGLAGGGAPPSPGRTLRAPAARRSGDEQHLTEGAWTGRWNPTPSNGRR